MARQIDIPMVEKLTKKTSYISWLTDKAGLNNGPLAHFLYDTDFYWSISDDSARAEAGLNLRNIYAQEMAEESGLSSSEKDRIRKSIHGQCSIFEVILALAGVLNEWLNDEDEDKTKTYFNILLENCHLDLYDEEDYDQEHGKDICTNFWSRVCSRIMDRTYKENGDGGLFPLKETIFGVPEMSLWQQLNNWVDEHTDDDGCFLME